MNPLAALLVLATLAPADLHPRRPYQLQTVVKPGPAAQSRYGGLWLSSYHTGAGLNDVVFSTARAGASTAFLNATTPTPTTSSSGDGGGGGGGGDGACGSNQLFDLGTDFAWGLQMVESASFYAAWQPVAMNAGVSGCDARVAGFFLNASGLQWTTDVRAPGSSRDRFGGWLVCDWWHGVPQLFFRFRSYPAAAYPPPAGCAEVDLVPQDLEPDCLVANATGPGTGLRPRGDGREAW